MRLRAEQPGRVREHRRGVGLGEPDPGEGLEEDLGVLARHVGVGLALGRRVAEVAEAVDDLLGRAAADPELEAAAGDEVGGPGVLDHVQRVLVAHVDDGRADLDALRPGADRREQRERRRELLGEVVDAEVGAVGAEVLDRLGQLDRLDERVRRRPHLRVRRRGPVPEREEPDLLHVADSTGDGFARGLDAGAPQKTSEARESAFGLFSDDAVGGGGEEDDHPCRERSGDDEPRARLRRPRSRGDRSGIRRQATRRRVDDNDDQEATGVVVVGVRMSQSRAGRGSSWTTSGSCSGRVAAGPA